MEEYMSRRQLKKDVLALLHSSSPQEIFHQLKQYPQQSLLNPLFIALCSPVEIIRWHAVMSFGWLVPAIAEQDMEPARIVMRRFLWSLNDESGGIGWGSPEAMAEIMCHSSPLRKEYLHMLISYMREDGECLFQDGNFLELPLLQRGLLWGVGRLCHEHRQEMRQRQIGADLRAYLDSTDWYVVGLALYCLGYLGSRESMEEIRRFRQCHEQLCLFLDHKIQYITVADLAEKALAMASENENPGACS